jgi:hypothetical protein
MLPVSPCRTKRGGTKNVTSLTDFHLAVRLTILLSTVDRVRTISPFGTTKQIVRAEVTQTKPAPCDGPDRTHRGRRARGYSNA